MPEGTDVLGPASVGPALRADLSPLQEGRGCPGPVRTWQCGLAVSAGHPVRWPCFR